MTSIAYFPVVHEEADLIDIISRAAWFLTFCPVDRIEILVDSAYLKDVAWRVADGMDADVSSKFATLKSRVKFVLIEQESDIQASILEAQIILLWKKKRPTGLVSESKLANWLQGKKVWDVDPLAIRMEGSFYIEVGLHLTLSKAALIAESKAKFERLAKRLGRFERSYLMATGPSVSHYKNYDFKDSLNIVCNSVILDEDLMEKVRPQILVFADPIFHFGPSQYAGAFRKSLVDSARRYDFVIIIPIKYYGLFIASVPELACRTIGVPFQKNRGWNFSLDTSFELRTTANILTFLMIPLAATFSNRVGILGCDGRPLRDNTYFWGHNKKTQINDKMANIKQVHPAFFAIDYNDYYLEHCQTLEAQLSSGEAAGITFTCLGFSHIPALKSRLGRGLRENSATNARKPIKALIIDPDGTNWSGHFMAYNEKLGNALLEEGCAVVVMCNREIDPEILSRWPHFQPRLSVPSWNVGQADSEFHPREFERELLLALERELSPAETTVIYLYAGSLEHVKAISMATQRFPNLYAHVNLFWLSFRDLSDHLWVEQWRPYFEWLDQTSPRVVATVPTREIQEEVAEVFGIILDVAPHPSTGVADYQQTGKCRVLGTHEPLTALFPGAPRVEKGYELALGAVRLLAESPRVKSVLRHVATSSPSNSASLTPPELPENAVLVEGSLSNEAFSDLFRNADFVVLPYAVDAFAKRTSGLLIDAIYHGLPAVVIEGTWLARVVKQYDCGVVVGTATSADLAKGIELLAEEYPAYLQRAKEAAAHYMVSNSWSSLAQFILAPLRSPASYPRVAAIDLTNIGGFSATGRVKEAFFLNWPASNFVLASYDGASGRMYLSGLDGNIIQPPASFETLVSRIEKFAPDVLYYRAVDNQVVHAFVTKVVKTLAKPLIVHIMDDWPERLRKTLPGEFVAYDSSLRSLLAQAHATFSIGDAMSRAFEQRYGVKFQPFANAVEPAAFPPRRRVRMRGNQFIIRYTGALADDMTLDSVKDIASAVESLPAELQVFLHIYTREPWLGIARTAFAGYRSIRVLQQVPSEDYYRLLQESDALIVAYNFDDRSRAYIGYSIANKMPEYLASGAPIIAYGPREVATIEYLGRSGAALVIDKKSHTTLSSEIRMLVESDERQSQIGKAARSLAFDQHNVWKVADGFRLALSVANGKEQMRTKSAPVYGAFSRGHHAHWDETTAVAKLFQGTLSGSTMIDVGAHHGSALEPFLNLDWQIFAFEPDNRNRTKLVERLAKHRNRGRVVLDTRCVSNEIKTGVSFFASEQSTGISGLSAFHESHFDAQKVDTISLSEYFKDRPLPAVDFLKIDTEGHDLFVLQGFPWERGKPAVIECEFEDSKTEPLGYTFHDLAGFLVAKGYAVYVSEWHPIVRYGIRHDWRQLLRYPCELADRKGWGNLLAFREAIDEQILIATVKGVLKVDASAGAPLPPTLPSTNVSYLHTRSSFRGRCFRLVPGRQFTALAEQQWRYTHCGDKQKLWVAAIDAPGPTANKTFGGCVRVRSDRAITLHISVARQGNTLYEGAVRRVTLLPHEEQTLKLSAYFKHSHEALKLQVEVLDLPGDGSALLRIDSLGITETLGSIRDRLGPDNFDFRTANRLFRNGDYATALGMYLWLSAQSPLSMYGNNAVMASRRCGMDWVRSVGDLSWITES